MPELPFVHLVEQELPRKTGRNSFRQCVKPVSGYIPESRYFNIQDKRDTMFDRGCKHILKQFNKKWHPNESRCEYMATFSPESWKRLPLHKKQTHTLENCEGCQLYYANMQGRFPGTQVACSSAQLIDSSAHSASATMPMEPIKSKHVAQCTTRKALGVINEVSENVLGMPFSKAIVKYCPEEKVANKPNDTERKRQQRKVMRKCSRHLEKQMGDREALNVLAENQSLSSYKRMRISQSFETPESKHKCYEASTPRAKKHSPNFDHVNWDKDKLQRTLANWPENEIINWSRVAREHGITTRNGGQIVKEFAMEIGFETTRFDRKTGGTRMRAKKLKMPGGEISVPCHKTVSMIKSDWADMIRSGELTLGEPCTPYTLTKYRIVGGRVERSECVVYGRKVPLVYIRKKFLQKHEPYMRLHTDVELQNMSRSELMLILNVANTVFDANAEDQQLRDLICKLERTRTLAIWHDHSTLLGKGDNSKNYL